MTTKSLTFSQTKSSYRWVILALCALTAPFVITLPSMSLPPMFAVISQDLDLSLVQVGTVWGMAGFTGIFFALIGGTLGDRFGSRRTLFMACLFTGVFGLLRGFAIDFSTLLMASLLFGFAQSIIAILLFKVIRQWFATAQLGMVSGIISAGFASGLTLGPLLSTSVILPLFGGWRQVLIFYGVIAIAFSLLWLIIHPREQKGNETQTARVSLKQSLKHVMKLRDVWIIGIGGLGIGGCFAGFTGYLPTYLKSIGWAELDADRALAMFFITSLMAVVPLSTLSDRLRLRRGFLIFAGFILATGIGSLTFVQGTLIVVVIAATGIVFDAFMAIRHATLLEVDGIGYVYTGTALGFAGMITNLGSAFSPPLGNSLVTYGPSVPFLFWGGLGMFGVFMFAVMLKSPKTKPA